MVKHRKTKETFLMKRIENNSPLRAFLMSEFEVLQTLQKCNKRFIELIDFFEEGESIYLIEKYGKVTLLDHVRDTYGS